MTEASDSLKRQFTSISFAHFQQIANSVGRFIQADPTQSVQFQNLLVCYRMASYNGATAAVHTFLNPTSDAPPSEALVLAALLVMLSCMLFAVVLAGPDPTWEEDGIEPETAR